MDERELKAILDANIKDAAGYLGGDLSDERSEAMDRYLGELYGNEKEGRSQVISRDVTDTIEWIMPFMMKTFTGTETPVEFDAVSAEDEPAAEQETDYVNHVFFKENPGWLILYTWIKDALLQKNGIVKVCWEESEEVKKEAYQGLSDDELLLIQSDDEVEILEHTTRFDPALGNLHDVRLSITEKDGAAKVYACPPEDVGISRHHNSIRIQDSDFAYHKTEKTISELIEAGYDRKKLADIPSSTDTEDEEDLARRHLSDEQELADTQDDSMRRVTVYECYLKVDYDGDGIAELRKVTKAGEEILDNEEIDHIPFCAITPIILTHKFFGLSIADIVKDLAEIKTSIWRQALDNMYRSNNQKIAFDDARVNPDDIMNEEPGARYRTKGAPVESIMTIGVQDLSQASFNMLNYTDQVMEGRTGVGASTQGKNESLLSSNKGDLTVERVMTAAEQRIELIARIFAETGIKDLFLMIHGLLLKYQDKEKVVKLRNKWVPINPREWRERKNMTVAVGLGEGEKKMQLMAMGRVLELQEKIIAGGGIGTLITEENIYNAVSDFVKLAGVPSKSQIRYFTDPNSPQAQQFRQMQQQQAQQQPDPNMMMIQAQQQIEAEKRQVEREKVEYERAKAMAQFEVDQAKLAVEKEKNDMRAAVDTIRQELEIAKLQAAKAEKIDERIIGDNAVVMEAIIKEQEALIDARIEASRQQLDQYKAELDNATKVQLESMRLAAQGIQADQVDQRELMQVMNGIMEKLSGDVMQPKEILRDENGRPVAIGGRKIKRDADGKIVGLE